ncbi:MAG: MFS transporter [Chloroflexota bacterium]
MKKIWPFTFYFLYFAAFASALPFFVLFYQELDFTGTQIGLLTGIPPLITLVASPFWTSLADARHWHKLVMSLGTLASVITIFLLPFFSNFIVIFILIILFYVFVSPVASLADSATITMLGEEREMYGRIRLGGTIGFGLFAPIAGVVVERYGLQIGFWMFSMIMLANLFVSMKFSHGTHKVDASNSGGVRVLLTNRRWIIFLFLAFLGGIGGTSAASYLFPYMAEMGASESMMGWALTIASLTEIPIFFFGNRFVRKFGSYGLLTLSLAMFGIRALLFAAVNLPSLVLFVQVFGGMIFPAMWAAGVSYADENAPAGLKSSAQGLFGAAAFGVGSAVSGFVSGLLLESVGGRGMFLALGIIILAGLGIAEGIRRLFPEKSELPQAVVLTSDK